LYSHSSELSALLYDYCISLGMSFNNQLIRALYTTDLNWRSLTLESDATKSSARSKSCSLTNFVNLGATTTDQPRTTTIFMMYVMHNLSVAVIAWWVWYFLCLIFMVALWNRADHYIFALSFVMAALCNRAGHIYLHSVVCSFFLCSPCAIGQIIYIFALWFLSSFLSSPNLSGRRLDVYHTSTHGVALVRI